MEVARAAQVRMLDDGVLGGASPAVERVGYDGGDALVGQRADGEGAGGHELGTLGIDILEQPQHAETGAEPLFGMGPVSQYGDHEPFGIRADRASPTTEAIGCPFGVATMRAWHMVGIGSVPAPAITALM